MGTGRVDVRPCLPRDAILLTSLEESEAILSVRYDVLALTFDKDASILVLTDHQGPLLLPILKQIEQLLVVDLQEGAVNSEPRVIARVGDIGLEPLVDKPLKVSEDIFN